MNKHIELVKKWLDDPHSVRADELRANVVHAAYADDAAHAACVAVIACTAAFTDAYTAEDVEYYVKEYEELTGE